MAERLIRVRGAAAHNLKNVDVDIPHGKLIVACGLSGSGKTSLALDTLYAEGQRRYIDSFSAYTRQFLERLEKPDAERIDGIPPAIAVTHKNPTRSNRATVGASTETSDYLRLLFAKIGRVFCYQCGAEVARDTPETTAGRLAALPAGIRLAIAFPAEIPSDGRWQTLAASLLEEGFVRAIVGGRAVQLADLASPGGNLASPGGSSASPGGNLASPGGNLASPGGSSASPGGGGGAPGVEPSSTGAASTRQAGGPASSAPSTTGEPWYVVVDRLASGSAPERLRDSLETAFAKGHGRCLALAELGEGLSLATASSLLGGRETSVDGRQWLLAGFSSRFRCENCHIDYPAPEPRLYNFNSPMGACPECEGFGSVADLDLDLIVPDPCKSIAAGAIAPWNTPAYAHELRELLALAPDYGLRVDAPFSQLTADERRIVVEGVTERKFGGLRGFFAWLDRRKYKMHLRVFLSRWRRYRPCPACHGARLRRESLATRVGGKNIAQLSQMKIAVAREFLDRLELTPHERSVARVTLDEARRRLAFLEQVGLGYLSIDRTLRTLSGGEAQRVALTSTLGSNLTHMLYVLDEPSIGLHPKDVGRLRDAILRLRDRGNTVVVVEHEESIIRAADQVIEIGPGAGERGGELVFQGSPEEMCASDRSLTGDYLAGRRGGPSSTRRRTPTHGWIRLTGARGNNLQNITVEFPLGVLCLVTGVSGAGKSTLVEDTLYPALCRRLRKEGPAALSYDDVFGDGQIEDVILINQDPIGRSPRSNPVTYIKAFDEIRAVFAETLEARTRNYAAAHFSFNVEGGRCSACNGDGYIAIDMQFLADVYMKCSQCGGQRYRKEILEVKYRGRNIAQVLELTVREAFAFFRGRPKVQSKLKRLIDVGLDYLRLGQPANTLSGGEAQRLKLANYLGGARRGRALFVLDEPTTGLHFQDVAQLLDCLDALLAVGNSLVVVEHNMQMIEAADYIIDLGPGAADDGGRVVAAGPPQAVARVAESATGQMLAQALAAV